MNEYLEQAISEVNNLNEGEEFLVRDLFKGYTWNRMTVGTKLSLDKLFLNEVNTNKNLKLVYSARTHFISQFLKN